MGFRGQKPKSEHLKLIKHTQAVLCVIIFDLYTFFIAKFQNGCQNDIFFQLIITLRVDTTFNMSIMGFRGQKPKSEHLKLIKHTQSVLCVIIVDLYMFFIAKVENCRQNDIFIRLIITLQVDTTFTFMSIYRFWGVKKPKSDLFKMFNFTRSYV